MTPKKKKQRKLAAAPKRTKIGQEIIESLTELRDALASGVDLRERFTVREVEIAEPRRYAASEVRAVRERLGMSQGVFAKVVGVSVTLAQSWEQGRRFPDLMARRLFDEIQREPGHWRDLVKMVG